MTFLYALCLVINFICYSAIFPQGLNDAKRTTNLVDALRIAKSGLVHPEIENKKVHKRIVVFAGGYVYLYICIYIYT